MAAYKNGAPLATNAFEAALYRATVKVCCACGHTGSFNGGGIWYLCHRHGWSIHFRDLRSHFYCMLCRYQGRGAKVRPRLIAASDGQPNRILPDPPDDLWKAETRRWR